MTDPIDIATLRAEFEMELAGIRLPALAFPVSPSVCISPDKDTWSSDPNNYLYTATRLAFHFFCAGHQAALNRKGGES